MISDAAVNMILQFQKKFERKSRFVSCMGIILGLAIIILPTQLLAERISNRVVVFSGLDKITGRIHSFDVYLNETVQFGALQITPRVCYSRPVSEKPKTTTFIEVDEITLDDKIRRIFTGWMFASSPGLNAVEHSVYDIWLKDCKMDSEEVPAPDNES